MATVVLTLPRDVTYAGAAACLPALQAALTAERDAEIRVDAAALARFDSSALAVLLALRRAAMRAGKRFAVQGLAPHLRELVALYGVDELLPGEAA